MINNEFFDDQIEGENIYCINAADQIGHKNIVILEKLINDRYLTPFRCNVPKIKCEMKLTLDNPKPFNCPSRRLAYSEKTKLQILIDEYLEKGYIRPSESEFVWRYKNVCRLSHIKQSAVEG